MITNQTKEEVDKKKRELLCEARDWFKRTFNDISAQVILDLVEINGFNIQDYYPKEVLKYIQETSLEENGNHMEDYPSPRDKDKRDSMIDDDAQTYFNEKYFLDGTCYELRQDCRVYEQTLVKYGWKLLDLVVLNYYPEEKIRDLNEYQFKAVFIHKNINTMIWNSNGYLTDDCMVKLYLVCNEIDRHKHSDLFEEYFDKSTAKKLYYNKLSTDLFSIETRGKNGSRTQFKHKPKN